MRLLLQSLPYVYSMVSACFIGLRVYSLWCNDWLCHGLYQSVSYIVDTVFLLFSHLLLMSCDIIDTCLLYSLLKDNSQR